MRDTEFDISSLFNDEPDNEADIHTHTKPSISAAIKAVIEAYAQSKSKNSNINSNNFDNEIGIKSEDLISNLIHNKLSGKIRCHHCSSNDVILYGTGRGKQRYMCKTCGRTFSALTNTPLSGTHHPEKWGAYMECMLKSLTLKESARRIKVSYVSLFYWRHKILSVLKDIRPEEMKGIVELDDIYLNYSKKGQNKGFTMKDLIKRQQRVHRKSDDPFNFEGDKVCVIAAADRYSNVFSRIACIGRPTGEAVEEAVGVIISDKNQICFNHKSAYYVFLHRRHLKSCRKSLFGIKNAKLFIKKCMMWIHRFMGVATSYLNNYLGWYKFLNAINFNETLTGVKKLMEVII